MTEPALSTLPRAAKGPIAPPPKLNGLTKIVADAVAAWPDVVSTAHWHLKDKTKVDGVDFYVGDQELGHIHLDGSIHLASNLALGAELVREGLGRPFPYIRGWTLANVSDVRAEGSIALFKRNYDRLRPNNRHSDV